jgi:hypothetical protein
MAKEVMAVDMAAVMAKVAALERISEAHAP